MFLFMFVLVAVMDASCAVAGQGRLLSFIWFNLLKTS